MEIIYLLLKMAKIEHKDITIILPRRGFGKRYALSEEQIKAIDFTKREPFKKLRGAKIG